MSSSTIDPRRVQYLPLTDLQDDPQNPKNHSMEEIDASIGRFGVLDLIVRDERTGKIISGHGRRKAFTAMQQRGEEPPEGVQVDQDGTWLVPVVTGWASRTDSEAAAALIALNRTTELGGWVDESLLELLEELGSEEDGFLGVGFDDSDLATLREALTEQEDEYGEGRIVSSPDFDDGEVDLGDHDHECPRCGFQF